MEILEGFLRFLRCFTFYDVGHKRRRGSRYGAADALKGYCGDAPIFHLELQREPVATKRVEAFRAVRRLLERALVSRPLAVIDDRLLIKIAEIRHYEKN